MIICCLVEVEILVYQCFLSIKTHLMCASVFSIKTFLSWLSASHGSQIKVKVDSLKLHSAVYPVTLTPNIPLVVVSPLTLEGLWYLCLMSSPGSVQCSTLGRVPWWWWWWWWWWSSWWWWWWWSSSSSSPPAPPS